MAMGRPYDLPYSVELWDDDDKYVEELIALTGDYRVARAAFEEAVKRRPGRIVDAQAEDAIVGRQSPKELGRRPKPMQKKKPRLGTKADNLERLNLARTWIKLVRGC